MDQCVKSAQMHYLTGSLAVRDTLTDAGYRVVEALSLDDARNLLDTHADVGLLVQGLDALTMHQTRELCRHYCKAFGERLPVVLLTSYGFDEEQVRGWGCADELLGAVRHNLGG